MSILQEHVRDQLVFGQRRFGPGSHCQKHGALELKGTKSKVYAAINTDQIWLHKSEMVRQEEHKHRNNVFLATLQ